MSKLIRFLLVSTLAVVPANLYASTIYHFSLTDNGTTQTVDAGSDTPAGTSLLVGDGFTLDYHTAGNDFWQVLNPTDMGIYAAFFVQTGGFRTANSIATFYNNGVQLIQDIDLGIVQQLNHVGAQNRTVVPGFQFDQIVVSYTLLASTASSTVIQNNHLDFQDTVFRPNVEYRQGASAVPEPASLMLFGSGLAALVVTRARRRR